MSRLRSLLLIAIAGLGLISALSFAAPLHWLLDGLANLRVQWALACLAVFLLATASRHYRPAVLSLPLLLLNGLPLLPYLAPPPAPAVANDGAVLRLATVNLHNWSTRSPQVQAMAEAIDADLIVVTEIAAVHHPAFAALRQRFAFQTPDALHVTSAFAIRLLSRYAFAGVTIHRPEGDEFPLIEARLCPPQWQRCLRLIALHAPRPSGDGRRERILRFAGELAGQPSADWTVIAGDLNLTPFSPVFGQLLARANLNDSMVGQGLQSSWLSRFTPLGLTLDHVLIDPALVALDRGRGPSFGSDHFPVIVDLRPR